MNHCYCLPISLRKSEWTSALVRVMLTLFMIGSLSGCAIVKVFSKGYKIEAVVQCDPKYNEYFDSVMIGIKGSDVAYSYSVTKDDRGNPNKIEVRDSWLKAHFAKFQKDKDNPSISFSKLYGMPNILILNCVGDTIETAASRLGTLRQLERMTCPDVKAEFPQSTKKKFKFVRQYRALEAPTLFYGKNVRPNQNIRVDTLNIKLRSADMGRQNCGCGVGGPNP